MQKSGSDVKTFVWRITATHTIAYMIAGILALTFSKYDELFGVGTLSFMRPTNSVWVAAGPGLQVLRGVLLALFLLPFRTIFIESKKGWIKFWLLSFGLSYFLTISAAVGSFEGFIYTTIPMKYHLLGMPEVVLYLTLFTGFMSFWYRKPRKVFDILASVAVSFILILSCMGVLSAVGVI